MGLHKNAQQDLEFHGVVRGTGFPGVAGRNWKLVAWPMQGDGWQHVSKHRTGTELLDWFSGTLP